MCFTLCTTAESYQGTIVSSVNFDLELCTYISTSERTTSTYVETEHILLLWHPLNKPAEGGNTLSVIRCRLVVQRRSRMGEQLNLPNSLQSTPVEYSHVFFLILPVLPPPVVMVDDWVPAVLQSQAAKCESILEHHAKIGRGVFFVNTSSGGTIPSLTGSWDH